jgi:hypothetical protein
MKAMNLIRRSSYGPERLKQIYQAFDQAWEAIKPLVDDNPLAREAARLTLANAILSVAKDDLGDRSSPRTAPQADIASMPPTKQSC